MFGSIFAANGKVVCLPGARVMAGTRLCPVPGRGCPQDYQKHGRAQLARGRSLGVQSLAGLQRFQASCFDTEFQIGSHRIPQRKNAFCCRVSPGDYAKRGNNPFAELCD